MPIIQGEIKRAFEAATSKAPHLVLPRRSILKPVKALKILGCDPCLCNICSSTTPVSAGVVFYLCQALFRNCKTRLPRPGKFAHNFSAGVKLLNLHLTALKPFYALRGQSVSRFYRSAFIGGKTSRYRGENISTFRSNKFLGPGR